MLSEKLLIDYLAQNNYPAYRLQQIWQGIFKDLVEDWTEITTLPKGLRQKLIDEIPFPKMTVVREVVSSDKQVHKVLFDLHDDKQTEAVLLDHHGKRTTVCVSCMTGCPVGCKFCATGKLGAGRNLNAEEIVAQVLYFNRLLTKEGRKVTNVVLMGMGEPFLNYDNVLNALNLFKHQKAGNIATRRLTVSTAGVISGIEKFTRDGGQICLAVSLHAPDQDLRAQIMPGVASKWRLNELMKSLDKYVQQTNRKVFYEYILLRRVNDSLDCARKLSDLLRGRLAHVNLIRYNQAAGGFQPSAAVQVQKFQEILTQKNIPSTVRASLGSEVEAACGQLQGKFSDIIPPSKAADPRKLLG